MIVYAVILILVLALGSWHQHDCQRIAVEQMRREKAAQERRFRALGFDEIDNMNGLEFEHYVCRLLIHRGFFARVTRGSHDFGVDIVAPRDGHTYAVQVKRQRKPVSRTAVSDAVAGMPKHKCDRAMVVTNNRFTRDAKELARSNGCELVDRDTLAQWISEFRQAMAG